MNTLKLDKNWDIQLDLTGNLVTTDEYIAQDVATACRTFQGEYPFDITYGIPYYADVLGEYDKTSLEHHLEAQARKIEGVNKATAMIELKNRTITGRIHINNAEDITL